ncbi:hypothetical protein B0H10DRAFT_1712617, partial [Mycena sp. CBHHK59/15]
FPPKPSSAAVEHRVITSMCDSMDPAKFMETGCAVCGELVPLTNLTLISDLSLNL